MAGRRAVVVLAASLALAAATASTLRAQDGATAPLLRLTHTVATPFPLATWAVHRLGDSTASRLVLVGKNGEIRIAGLDAAGAVSFRGTLAVPDPARALLAIGRLDGRDRPPSLVHAGPGGIALYPIDADGIFATTAIPLLRRPRFLLRTGHPSFAGLVEDLNADGRGDLLLPNGDALEVWMSGPEGDGAARGLRLATTLPVDIDRRHTARAELLSDVLENSFTIPRPRLLDVNGDGRTDVVVRGGRSFAWHVQKPDGTLPADPDVAVDLKLFRDTTPEASIRPGRTLAGGDRTRLVSRDLDGDGVLDAVIAHRRKVWVFPGTRAAPQFADPSAILKTADDVTALLLVKLDDDARPDLLILRVQVPTVATLVLGMLGSWDVDLAAIGYRNLDGRRFETTPAWKRELTFTMPSIASILKDPDALLRRFEDAGRKFRADASGDFDGDGLPDLALATPSGDAVDVWRGRPGDAQSTEQDAFDRLLRRLLFEDPDPAWNLDRALELFGSLADERTSRITRGREADFRLPLRRAANFRLSALSAADLCASSAAELVAAWSDPRDGALASIEVFGRE